MTDFNGTSDTTELNPRPIRSIKLMGMVSLSDWILFIAGAIVAILALVIPSFSGGMMGVIIKLVIVAIILIPWAAFCFVQNATKGKLRTRLWRALRNIFVKKDIAPAEMHAVYTIKEVNENHIHYKGSGSNGYCSIYRLEGFNPLTLQPGEQNAAIDSMSKFFEAKFRFKIVSCQIKFYVPQKNFKLQSNHPGVNYAKNTYISFLNEVNTSTDMKEQAYFILIESISPQINDKNFALLANQAAGAHLVLRPALPNELEQMVNEFWFDGFSLENPRQIGVRSLKTSADMVQIDKTDGSHEYVAYRSYTALPEYASALWLSSLFNADYYSILVDINDVMPQEAVKHMEEMQTSTDNLIQTKWFRKRATDNDRMRIAHVKEQIDILNQQLVNSSIGMKQIVFYMCFRAPTKKMLKKNIDDFKSKLYTFNTGWQFYDCRFLQMDAFVSTRLFDLPALQYRKSTSSFGKTLKSIANVATSGINVQAESSMVNKLPIVNSIDHYLLTTSLGLGFPFMVKGVSGDTNAWFKGWDTSDGSLVNAPFLNNYWKVNEMYNSFNRFYQGRNGSGKSYTADLDMVADRLDDKFIISIDPKPERVLLTENLGGNNVYIGAADVNAPCINIFDVLVVPNLGEGASDPLSNQYQANLVSISMLLSLSPEIPDDKVILSCFNDVQQFVYEKKHRFTPTSDFNSIPRNKMPVLKEFYDEIIKRASSAKTSTDKIAFNKLQILLKEHAVGVSAHLFNRYTNVIWGENRMWNFIVKEIALNYGNKNILACWVTNILRVSSAFMISGQQVCLYIDELHLIHNINGVLAKLDEFARIDRSFKSALCLINQNFNSIRSTADLKKKEYYESIFTMSQYNLFFTTGEEDVQFLVEMLSGSGQPLSDAERRYMTQAGRGKALLLMTAYDRYQVQFEISFWQSLWEKSMADIQRDVAYNRDVAALGQIQEQPAQPEQAFQQYQPQQPQQPQQPTAAPVKARAGQWIGFNKN